MGDGLYLRHRLQSRAERIIDGLQGPLLQVDIAEIIVHEGDEPNAVVDLLDAEFLTGQHGRDIAFLAVRASGLQSRMCTWIWPALGGLTV
jgi:hypothetical protein